MSEDELAIRSVITSWMEATKRGDVDAVLPLMADDAIFLVAGQPPMTKAAFEGASRSQSTAGLQIQGVVDIQEVRVEHTMAYAWSNLQVTVTQPGAKGPVRRVGHTLTVFRKEGGRWLLSRDANLLVMV